MSLHIRRIDEDKYKTKARDFKSWILENIEHYGVKLMTFPLVGGCSSQLSKANYKIVRDNIQKIEPFTFGLSKNKAGCIKLHLY